MVQYMDGLAWAAINVSYLQYPPEHVASYYFLGAVMMIASVLAIMLPEKL